MTDKLTHDQIMDICDGVKRYAIAVFMAVELAPAKDISLKFDLAANAIEQLLQEIKQLSRDADHDFQNRMQMKEETRKLYEEIEQLKQEKAEQVEAAYKEALPLIPFSEKAARKTYDEYWQSSQAKARLDE